jgi:dienelactone hydrolase
VPAPADDRRDVMNREGAMRALCSAILALAVMPMAAQAQDAKQIAARVELHAIPSLTLSDQQFLAGDANGKAVTVTGEFRIAQGAGKLPVVILIHGSGGMGPNIESWARDLNAMGVSTFALDGFTGRGLTSVNMDQAALGRLAFTLDAYRILEILAKHPRVDPARIALMGFSRGGQGVLFASLKRFHQTWNKSGAEFAAYIPFYPDCMTTYISDTDVDKPIRIFHGTPDDYNPVASCKRYVERLRAAGRDVQLTEYPNAQHGFDNPLGAAAPTMVKGAQTVRACQIAEEPKGVLINAATKEPFTYKDPCVQQDPHVNHDAEATAAVKVAVKDFLKTTFRLATN